MGGGVEGPAYREGDAERPGSQQDCSARKRGAVQEHNKYYFRRGPQKKSTAKAGSPPARSATTFSFRTKMLLKTPSSCSSCVGLWGQRCQSLPLREPIQTRKQTGGGNSTLPSSPGFPPCASLAGCRSRATRGANVQLTRLAAARSQRPLCSCGVMAKCVSFYHVLMRRTGWNQINWRTRNRSKRDMPPSTG